MKEKILFLIFIAILAAGSLSPAADDSESNIMKLVSETANCSAKLTRNKKATEEEKNKDRERKRIGIGEEVTVTLASDKSALLEPKDQIKWKVDKGKELIEGELERIYDKPYSVKFRVNPNASKEQIKQSGGITISVETQQRTALPEPIEFTVVFPEQLTAEHETLGGLTKGSPMPEYPQDKSDDPSASAMLKVSVHPLDVCFSGIKIIEKDKGYEGDSDSLAEPHQADSIWMVSEENRFLDYDNIGFKPPRTKLNAVTGTDAHGQPIYKHSYPNEFTWNCLFRTCAAFDNEGISDIVTVYQSFHVNRSPNDQWFIKIEKFLIEPEKEEKISVERTTNADHIFIP